jgi:hypothetical protein
MTSRKRSLSHTDDEVDVTVSIKNMKVDSHYEMHRTISTDSQSGLLPPLIHPNEILSDANYKYINPILREAHYLRQLRLSQRSSVEMGLLNENQNMEN